MNTDICHYEQVRNYFVLMHTNYSFLLEQHAYIYNSNPILRVGKYRLWHNERISAR